MDKILKALAEKNRRQILHWLVLEKLTVGEITKRTNLTQGTVSSHLSVLRKAGVVKCLISGKNRIYEINRDKVDEFVISLNNYFKVSLTDPNIDILVRN